MKFKFLNDPVQTHAGKMLVGAIVCIFLGTKGIVQTPPLEKLEYHKGRLEWIKDGYVQFKDTTRGNYGVTIKLNGNESIFGTWVAKHIVEIKKVAKKNANTEIWLGNTYGEIEQIKVNNDVVVEYDQFSEMYIDIGFLVVGLFLLAIMVYAIAKHPEVISSRIAERKGIELD